MMVLTIVSIWQQKVRRWIVKVKKTLRRQTWRERILASGVHGIEYKISGIL